MGHILGPIAEIASIAAIPLTGGASAAWTPWIHGLQGAATLTGMLDQRNQQNAQNAAYSAAMSNQSRSLQGVESLAQQLATGPNMQPIFDAEGSGVKTLQSKIGGVANPGNLIKELYGQNIGNGIGAALNTRSGDLQGGINALLQSGSQYGQMGSRVGAAAGGPNPYVSGFTALAKLGLPNRNANTGTQTGLGAPPNFTGDYYDFTSPGGPVIQNDVYQPTGGYDPVNVSPDVPPITLPPPGP